MRKPWEANRLKAYCSKHFSEKVIKNLLKIIRTVICIQPCLAVITVGDENVPLMIRKIGLRLLDIYEVDGAYHACNPSAIVSLGPPFSKNKRVVSVFDTDCPGGSQVGLVAMIEVVALMIGDINLCYSRSIQCPASTTTSEWSRTCPAILTASPSETRALTASMANTSVTLQGQGLP
jgi:hypothetical protein